MSIGVGWRFSTDVISRLSVGRALVAITLVGLELPLLAFGVQGWFARYAADDYCTAGQVDTVGFLNAQSLLYVSWSGRFAATLLITLAELVGPWAVRVLPLLTLVAWVAATTWAARQIGRAAGYAPSWWASALAGTVVVYATLQTTADLPQVLYWQTGLLTYLAPLVLFTLLGGCIARSADQPRPGFPVRLGVCFVLAFVAGGTNETFAAAQVTTLALAMVLCWLMGSGAARRRLVIALLGSLAGALLALGLVALAPGNAVRAQTTIILPIQVVLVRDVEFTRGWLRLTFARPHVVELLLLIGITGVLGAIASTREPVANRPRWALVVLAVIGLALVLLACMVPAFYALGADPPGRALLVPQYLLMGALAGAAWLAGAYAAPRRMVSSAATTMLGWSVAVALLVLLALGPVASAARVADQLGADRDYANAWDRLDRQIRAERAQGNQDLTVVRLNSTGTVQNLEFFGLDRQDWLNACVARYYAINSIAATP